MAKIIKVRCNGPGRHINEIDVEALITAGRVTVYRVIDDPPPMQLRKRYVQPCGSCAEGAVIVTREMIEEALSGD